VPVITKIEPDEGSVAGGTTVTIIGERLTENEPSSLEGGLISPPPGSGISHVKFGGVPSTDAYGLQFPNEIKVVSPAGAGTVDITVTTIGGTSAAGPSDRFTYLAPSGNAHEHEEGSGSTATPSSDFTLKGRPEVNLRTGAVTFTVSVAYPGTLSWSSRLRNDAIDETSAPKTTNAAHCKSGQSRIRGRCQAANIAFGNGSKTIAVAGVATFTISPGRAARTALENALKRGRGLPLITLLGFRATGSAGPVSHSYSITVKLKKSPRRDASER
jgi:hypothetical protein